LYYKGPKYQSILEEFRNYLRSEIKYSQTRTQAEVELFEEIREKLFEISREELE
jgi:hypothetical protein